MGIVVAAAASLHLAIADEDGAGEVEREEARQGHCSTQIESLEHCFHGNNEWERSKGRERTVGKNLYSLLGMTLDKHIKSWDKKWSLGCVNFLRGPAWLLLS